MQEKKIKYKIILFAFLSAIFLSVLYYFQFQVNKNTTDPNLIYRRIDTPVKFLLNGYLGHFFNFKYLGNINWLFIPLVIFAYLKTDVFKSNANKGLLFAYFTTLLLISVKGFFNSRYQLTLFPITLGFTLYFSWLLLKYYQLIHHAVKIYTAVFVFILINNVVGLLFMKDYIDREIEHSKKGKFYFLTHPPEAFEKLKKKKSKPQYAIIDYISKLPNDKNILVNNLPMLYYYTNKRGIYYWCGDDTYYTSKGRSLLVAEKNFEQLSRFITDSLKCNYLLSNDYYNKHNDKFNEFVLSYCKPLVLDNGEYVLYEITSEKSNYSLKPFETVARKKLEQSQQYFTVTQADVDEYFGKK